MKLTLFGINLTNGEFLKRKGLQKSLKRRIRKFGKDRFQSANWYRDQSSWNVRKAAKFDF